MTCYRPLTLHSTMYLLNRNGATTASGATATFTFHNVSIKSLGSIGGLTFDESLHSTMYLLNR